LKRFARYLSPTFTLAVFFAVFQPVLVKATTLDDIKARGYLVCGVRTDQPAFSSREERPANYRGFEADICRAMAIAVFDSADRVHFAPLDFLHQFFDNQAIDVVLHGLTHTLERERKFAIGFSSVYFYDGQAFMTPVAADVRTVAQLRGKHICLREGGEAERNLKKYPESGFLPVFAKDDMQAQAAFLSGRCDAYTADESLILSMIARGDVDSAKYRVLPERISKEPLAGITRRDDAEILYLLNAVLAALVEAEERGIVATEVAGDSSKLTEKVQGFKRWANVLAPQLPADWAVRVVYALGNYGELYERHFAKAKACGIERGLNRPWNAGGILYALPLR
jgi:general L-amino acid transport system substrate-binding protein